MMFSYRFSLWTRTIVELRLERLDEEAVLPIAKNFWLLFGQQRPEGRPMNQQ